MVIDKILSLIVKPGPDDVQFSMVREWCVYFKTELKRWCIKISRSIYIEPIKFKISIKVGMCKAEYNILIYINRNRGSLIEKDATITCREWRESKFNTSKVISIYTLHV